jgi:hypothetical protein
MNTKRLRTGEIVAGYVYKALSESYGKYRNELRHTGSAAMSIKQSRVIDLVMEDNTTSDLSDINPIAVTEAKNEVTFKGLSGMNSDRSYGLDKRTYDKSMTGVLALSTGFSSTVGITRWSTIDMNTVGKRGFIRPVEDPKDMNITNNFSVAESLVPFGTTRDDPIRSAMGFIQISKHGMRVKGATPSLISTGGDQALVHLTSDVYAFKAKDKGKVIEITDEYMIIKYDGMGRHDYVSLAEQTKKNSNGGTYVVIKLDTDLKVGDSFTEGDIIAKDKLSFSDNIGKGEPTFNNGVLARVAVMNTDECFEDSSIVSYRMAKELATDVGILKSVYLPKDTNVYQIVEKGNEIKEGEHLVVFQNAFEEEDLNILLRNLAEDIDGNVSELGRIPVKSKISGKIQDVILYRTVPMNELSPSLKKLFTAYEKAITEKRKKFEKLGIPTLELPPNYAVDPVGKFKDAADGVLIEFLLVYEDLYGVGDKLVYNTALKGVCKDVIPEGQEPYPMSDPERKIDCLFAVMSSDARMVTSLYPTGVINSCLIELDRKIKKMLEGVTI